MDWNNYLFNAINRRIEENFESPVFLLSDADGKVNPLNNNLILEYINSYIKELKRYDGRICVIYHDIDERLTGFIIAAFSCKVKILIRRTTLESGDAVYDDISGLKKVLPVHLIYDNDGIHILDNGECNVKYDTGNFDYIQLSSGTTETAKAFCLSIEGMINSAYHIEKIQHVDDRSVFLSYLTLSHIYGFVSGFILPIVSCAKGVFCKTSYIKNDSDLLFKIISAEKITHTSVIMSTLIQGIENKSEEWDLSSLICASLGGEKVDIENFNRILSGLSCLGMNKKALVNSYGMSEKGSITMEDPFVGNTVCMVDGNTFVSVGNDTFEDTEIIILNDQYCKTEDFKEGIIGIASPYMAAGYFRDCSFYNLEYVIADNKKYYCNGDKGFIRDNKVFVTGRMVNTITYNGLKIASDLLNDSIAGMFRDCSVMVRRCYTFNYPEHVNYVVCFVDYSEDITDAVKKIVCERTDKHYHIRLKDVWVNNYEGHGLNKISLPDIIKKYKNYLKNNEQERKNIHADIFLQNNKQ